MPNFQMSSKTRPHARQNNRNAQSDLKRKSLEFGMEGFMTSEKTNKKRDERDADAFDENINKFEYIFI